MSFLSLFPPSLLLLLLSSLSLPFPSAVIQRFEVGSGFVTCAGLGSSSVRLPSLPSVVLVSIVPRHLFHTRQQAVCSIFLTFFSISLIFSSSLSPRTRPLRRRPCLVPPFSKKTSSTRTSRISPPTTYDFQSRPSLLLVHQRYWFMCSVEFGRVGVPW